MKNILNKLWVFLTFSIIISCSKPIKSVDLINENGKKIGVYHVNPKTGQKEGIFEKFSIEGKKIEESIYKADKLEGERKIYDKNGVISVIENHKNGVFDGEYSAYFPNGKLKLKGQYVNNTMEGLWIYNYESGERKEEVNMHDNMENGPFVEFYLNGKKKAEGNYKDGDKEDGLLLMYNEAGELVKKMDCKSGICKTIWKKE